MKLFIKNYKYIILFLIFILVISYICVQNYTLIENNTGYCNRFNFIPTNENLFKPQNTQTTPPVTFYNYRCSTTSETTDSDDSTTANNCIIGFYTSTILDNNSFITDVSHIAITGDTIQEKIDNCAVVANNAKGVTNVDFFAIDESSDQCNCYMYSLNTVNMGDLNAEADGLRIKNTSIPTTCNGLEDLINHNNDDKSYYKLGFGGFTNSGIDKIRSGLGDFVTVYDPVCDSMKNQESLTNEIYTCINGISQGTSTSETCNTIINNYKTSGDNYNGILGNIEFTSTTPDYQCNDRECIEQSFEDSNYLGQVFNSFKQNSVSNSSYADFSKNLYNFKMAIAEEQESKMDTTSTYIKYLLLIVIIIITVIMFFLNITNPDIVTAEVLISYIIFLVLLIFFTSNYFNVDYGPLNKFLSLHLGNAGDRNVFQSIGYSA